jgi:hypothetical protein
MRRIRIQRKPGCGSACRRPEVLQLDARDPDIVRAKQLLRERSRRVLPPPQDAQ